MRRAPCYGHRDTGLIEIWTDDAPGERRAALVVNNEIVEIHIQRDLHPILGMVGAGRIDRQTPTGSYVIGDNGFEVLVRANTGKTDGAPILFQITRESIAEPGRVKPAEGREIADALPMTDVNSLWADRLQNLDISGAAPIIKPFGESFDRAMAGSSRIGDVTVHFQRTKAGLVFDVDGIGDPFAINAAAAREIARLLRLYQIGGMAIVDFVAVDSKSRRQDIADIFDAASVPDGRAFERSAINGFGLMQIVRSRPRPSVLDQLFGARIGALSDETQALWLYRDVARSSGFGPRIVTTSENIASLMLSSKWQELRTECERITGAAMSIVVERGMTGYGHVHVAQS
jgi:ribonuclease G